LNNFSFIILFIASLLLCVIHLNAQQQSPSPSQQFKNTTIESRDFENTEWKKATKGLDYRNSTKDRKNVNEDVGDSIGGLESTIKKKAKNLGGEAGAIWNGLVKIVFVLFAMIIIGIIIYSIIRGENIFKKKKKVPKTTTFDLEEVETNLAISDLDKFITQAENQGNFPLAIRLHYLAIIKELSRKKIIRYKKNKTNYVYVTKVNTTTFGAEFQQATYSFERIWFGQNTFTQSDYQRVKPDFQKWLGAAQNLSLEKPSLKLNTP